MMESVIISFVGIDGSGKSTLAEKTYENLLKKNKKVKLVYGRFVPFLSKITMKMGRKIFLAKRLENETYENYLDNKKEILKKKSMLAKIYINLIIFEYIFEIFFKIILPKKMGQNIITDRYVYDTIINDIAIDMGLNVNEVNMLLKKFWKILPRPNIAFFIDIPAEIAFKRKNDIPSINFLTIRKNLYDNIEGDEKIKLDGTLELEELEKIVNLSIEKIGL